MSDKMISIFCGAFVKTTRFMEYCGRGLEGGYVILRALIKDLVHKKQEGYSI